MSAEANVVVQAIVSELANLPDEKIVEVLDFVRFLRVRYSTNIKRYAPRVVNEEQWTELYTDSAEEDILLAEAGLEDYAAGLAREDYAILGRRRAEHRGAGVKYETHSG
ncbi:MAG: hypothetical protein IT331_17740 [Anaerolineae bacterium]|nr:hypothetical protein [Anaerolineae bacterium]